ncbi:CPBP family intramembrane glutamic endopeptidase [Thalassomonas actiniarum]|uniref:CPBP family intramembrane metalloprotease n=1 Tax=Thalassomonas actiniarum TaxID=485447 RepID=A0AAE9YPU9_9GAMM|nr:type II CAAX endopeptidase family protein [Thalassomonas actiniarum]WDD97352.1 CPBP family intramembrane metalloprotease [Thalassomonas actiniarum]
MTTPEYLLIAYFILNPVFIFFSYHKDKKTVTENPAKKITLYRWTLLFLWLPTLFTLALSYSGQISVSNLGISWHWNWITAGCLVLLLFTVTYLLFSLAQIKKRIRDDCQLQKSLNGQLAQSQWFMPTTPRETRYFIFAISVSAGICEELLFRGYLLNLLSGLLPDYAAVTLSAILFALPHIYQGVIPAMRTFIMGVIFALLYLLTDSIIICILLHITLDIYAGILAYLVFQSKTISSDHSPQVA